MRIEVLRKEYCAKCRIKAPRSTGVGLLLRVANGSTWRVLDYGCSNWRNSKFLEGVGSTSVRVDAIPDTRPDVVAYPTHMPFRDSSFDVVLFTHIFMFLEEKSEWPRAASELARISRRYLVVETYRVKHVSALKFEPREIEELFAELVIKKRHVRRDLQVYVYQRGE